jgi:hypothetical protein
MKEKKVNQNESEDCFFYESSFHLVYLVFICSLTFKAPPLLQCQVSILHLPWNKYALPLHVVLLYFTQAHSLHLNKPTFTHLCLF